MSIVASLQRLPGYARITARPTGRVKNMNEVTNNDDVIDSRDVIARIEELEAIELADDEELAEDEETELVALRKLAAEAADYAADWPHGETLIRDSYFVEYAQELAADIGAINPDAGWPNNCIDWERAAWELRMDYSSVEFDGVTYWTR